MKMTIEYEIRGVTAYLPSVILDEGIEAAKRANEFTLRVANVFGDIKHEIVKSDEDVFMQLRSSGKALIQEIENA